MEPRLLQAPGPPPYSSSGSQSPAGRNRNRNRYGSSHNPNAHKPPQQRYPPKAPSDGSGSGCNNVRLLPPPSAAFFLDPFSLSPSALAAAVHQLVKEITAQAPSSGPLHKGNGNHDNHGNGGDPKAQRKEWQRQK